MSLPKTTAKIPHELVKDSLNTPSGPSRPKPSSHERALSKESLLDLQETIDLLTEENQGLKDDFARLQKERRGFRQREEALKAALDEKETQLKAISDKGNKFVSLQNKVQDLEKSHMDGKQRHQTEVETLRNELNQAKRLAAEQKSKVERLTLQNQSSTAQIKELRLSVKEVSSESDDLTTKLAIAQKEKNIALGKNAELGQVEARRKAEDRSKSSKISELEKQLAEALALNKTLENRRNEAESKSKSTSQETATRLRLVEQNAIQQLADTKNLKQQLSESNAQLEEVEESLRSREEDLVAVKEMLATAAKEYGRLYSSTVQRSLLLEAKQETNKLQFQAARLERRASDREAQVRQLAELIRQYSLEKAGLSETLAQAYLEIDGRAVMHAELLQSFNDSKKWKSNDDQVVTLIASLQSRPSQLRESILILDHHHSHVFMNYYEEELRQLRDSYKNVQYRYEDSAATVRALETTVADYQATNANLLKENECLEKSATTATNNLQDREAELTKSRAELAGLVVKMDEVEVELRKEIRRAEDTLVEELDKAKGVQNFVSQCQAREHAYKDDIDALVEQVENLGRYERAYSDLIKEVNVLVSRNALAEDEAQHLSHINAEILSHTNPNQKIFYVDKIRRELAEVKHNLINVTCELEGAEKNNAALTAELTTYKSLSLPMESKPGTKLTRVTRVPFGERNGISGQTSKPELKGSQEGSKSERPMTIDELK